MACDIIAIRFFINHSMKKEISQKIKVDLIYSILKKIKFYLFFIFMWAVTFFIGRCYGGVMAKLEL